MDVTDHEGAEEALQASEERFRTLLQFSFDVYWQTDAQHRFTRQEFSGDLADAPARGSEIGKTRWEAYLEPEEEAWHKRRATLEALDRARSERFHADVPLNQREGLRRDEHGARHGHLLQAGRDVGRLADRGVVHVQIASDGTHDDLTGVESDSDLNVHAVSVARVISVSLHRLLHPQRRIARSHRVVLMRQRGAEQRHDAVAHHWLTVPS
jgi:PAS domain-containing protein